MKQRPFILLELFIAMALLSLAIIPIVSYPAKIYKKELHTLIEIELAEVAEVAFRDLLEDLSSYLDPESFEPLGEITKKPYTVLEKYQYLATWDLVCKLPKKEPFDKALLTATLVLIPMDPKSPKPEPFTYRYFIAKKASAPHGEVHENSQSISPLHSGGENNP